MEYKTRAMEEKDIEQVQHVAKMSWNDTYEGIIPFAVQERFLNSAYSKEMMIRRLNVSSLYVAESQDRIVGFANFSLVKEAGEMELGAIYLLPEHQGNGIGSALLNKGITMATSAKKVFINVEKENRTGVRFYEARGFDFVSEFEDDLEGHKTLMLRMVLIIENY
ncbi:GNAT family N-acetyltransferase [Planococcus salinarum]|uniref:GNAT family N-acetyltransferase n=1 Tax=Planococcus salinarum TaxID=622695 RepID=UPI000E3D2700|nr:GNAT family N-acetyltransferase [Planococcus salinarum]TAA72693.1 GNAT family N-acetyltransferase [Planococcus salinarum]